jgi:nucleotide-binding universal stress UspA family protein
MGAFGSILCAIDFSPLALRVLRHAVGFAGAFGARLTVVTVTDIDARQAEATVAALVRDVTPHGARYVKPPVIHVVRVTLTRLADAVLAHARDGIDLVVAGKRSRSWLSRWLPRSNTSAILTASDCPVLLVPPGRAEIVALDADTARLVPGTVMAAVDLEEQNAPQVVLAAEVAALARQPLALMTVAGARVSDAEAEAVLRSRALTLGPGRLDRVMVRRGSAADAIDHATVAEHAGLVVMGLRIRGSEMSGEIARAALGTREAVVLAVPAG